MFAQNIPVGCVHVNDLPYFKGITYLPLLCHFVLFLFNVPVNNFTFMSGRSNRFLGIIITFWEVTLRLHYVPDDHGSHGSPKRSAPCDLVNFCLGTQVLLSIFTFRHGLSRYPLQTVG